MFKKIIIGKVYFLTTNHKKYPPFFYSLFIAASLLFTANPAHANYDDAMKEYKAGRYAASIKLFEQASDEGDNRAKYQLARMLTDGQGVTKNGKRAFELLTSIIEVDENTIEKITKQLESTQAKLDQVSVEKEKAAQIKSKIGQSVCRTGALTYAYQPKSCQSGRCMYINQRLLDRDIDSQVQANIENVSSDGKRIQVRVIGWYSPRWTKVEQSRQILEPPVLDGTLTATPGTVTWDDANSWFSCSF